MRLAALMDRYGRLVGRSVGLVCGWDSGEGRPSSDADRTHAVEDRNHTEGKNTSQEPMWVLPKWIDMDRALHTSELGAMIIVNFRGIMMRPQEQSGARAKNMGRLSKKARCRRRDWRSRKPSRAQGTFTKSCVNKAESKARTSSGGGIA